MKPLRPFFSYFGAKWRLSARMPRPAYDVIVEPFAGSAGYSLRYGGGKKVILRDLDPVIVGVWRYLICADPRRIAMLPDIPAGATVDDFDLLPAEKHLIGFWLNKGTVKPVKGPSKWARSETRPDAANYWGRGARKRIISQLPAITSWRVSLGSYTDAENREATWHVDPPYINKGRAYAHGAGAINFPHLADWCRERQGQVMVCEQEGADWLPFSFLREAKGNVSAGTQKYSREVLWHRASRGEEKKGTVFSLSSVTGVATTGTHLRRQKQMSKELKYLNPNHITIVGIDTEATDETTLYDERIDLDVDPNLVKNIIVYGVQQPVLVREESGEFIVVDGRQRVRAARAANKQLGSAGEVQVKVPVVSVNGDDKRVTGIMISSNEQRRDDDVLIKARKALRMLDMVGDKADVALAFGRTTQTINAWLRLANADLAVHEAIENGQISASAGVEIAGMDKTEQAAAVEKLIGGKSSSAAAANKQKGGRKIQAGVKRSWVRKALETDAFAKLKPQQRAALEWFATGVAEKGTWMDDFMFEVESEMEDAAAAKKAKKEAKQEAASSAPEPVTDVTGGVTPTEHKDEEIPYVGPAVDSQEDSEGEGMEF